MSKCSKYYSSVKSNKLHIKKQDLLKGTPLLLLIIYTDRNVMRQACNQMAMVLRSVSVFIS